MKSRLFLLSYLYFLHNSAVQYNSALENPIVLGGYGILLFMWIWFRIYHMVLKILLSWASPLYMTVVSYKMAYNLETSIIFNCKMFY